VEKLERPISVLYIHCSGVFGGASRSLLELIRTFPYGSVKAHLITQKGNVQGFFENAGAPVISTLGISQFDNTEWGYYRGYRWLLLARETWFSLFAVLGILRARRKWKNLDLVHVNEITMALPIILSKLILKKPVVVHCRSVQRRVTNSLRSRILVRILKRYTDRVIAIDETVSRSLPSDIKVEIVHNGYSPEPVGCPGENTEEAADAVASLPKEAVKIGMVGNLLEMKGPYDFLEAARLCSARKSKAVFIVVGDNVRTVRGMRSFMLRKWGFAHDLRAGMEERIRRYGMEDYFHLLGFTADIQKIYECIDVLCFPSHLNAVGRPVIEAAFNKVPSIVSIDRAADDTIIHGQTGICVPPGNVKALAEAMMFFCANPCEIKRMGEAAYHLALKNFDMKKSAYKVLNIYRESLGQVAYNKAGRWGYEEIESP
jgi:glycosyltransferase involved in cell wall biosynthesis